MAFEIHQKDQIGRYMVAKENLQPGQLIFREKPFVFGPKFHESAILCLGCYAEVDGKTLCSKCFWPVCSASCEEISCHKDLECGIFKNNFIKFNGNCVEFDCISPLRVLLMKEHEPKRWDEEVSQMESHDDVRKHNSSLWKLNDVNIVQFLRKFCKNKDWTEELIHRVCGILEINAFEARTTAGTSIQVLYPNLAIMSHNCVSNIHHGIDQSDFTVAVHASVELSAGQELFSSYTYSLWPTLLRRDFLRQSKYFECSCARCSSKTELDTHSSTLKCNKCDNGIILSLDPLNDLAEWKCTLCPFTTSGAAVFKAFKAIQQDIEEAELEVSAEGLQNLERIYKKYKSILHPQNAFMTILRTSLSQLYGKVDGYTVEDLPDLLLERKVELCESLLKVLDVIEPGFSRIRGVTLYELHAPLMLLARHSYQSQVIDKNTFRNHLQEALDILGKSVEILQMEPDNSSEGQLGRMAFNSHQQLTQNFELLVENA